MPDTTHWIVVPKNGDAHEVHEPGVAEFVRTHGECVHLVPTRVWRDYEATRDRLAIIRNELRTYKRATFVIQAALDGYPMPPKP